MTRFILITTLLISSGIANASTHRFEYFHVSMDGNSKRQPFYIDMSGKFPQEQRAKMSNAMEHVLNAIQQYYFQNRALKHESDFEKCVKKFATKDWISKAINKPGSDKKTIISSMMTGMVLILNKHKQKERRGWITEMSRKPGADGIFTKGEAQVGSKFTDADFDVRMNTFAVGNDSFDAKDIAGTIFHELMHRLGFQHPTGYPGSFIKEAGLCVQYDNERSGFGLNNNDYRHRD